MTDQTEPTQDVQPGPVPTGIAVTTVANDAGHSMVLLRLSTPMGVGFYFLDAETAVQAGNALRNHGKAGLPKGPRLVAPPSSGLIVPKLGRA
jgi:hypothetical protein